WGGAPPHSPPSGPGGTSVLLAFPRPLPAGEPPAMSIAGANPRATLFAGCDALAQGGDAARAALAVARELGAPLELVPETALCCGLKLVEAGHPVEFAAHAARVRGALGTRPVHLVFL